MSPEILDTPYEFLQVLHHLLRCVLGAWNEGRKLFPLQHNNSSDTALNIYNALTPDLANT
jgi:hypothetical protein